MVIFVITLFLVKK